MDFWDNLWNIILWSLWFFFVFAWIMLMIRIFMDLWGDDEIGWVPKVLWSLGLVFFSLITVLAYLIVRGKGMGERSMAKHAEAQKAQAQYIRTVAGKNDPTQQIASAKALLDSGAITQAEYDKLKADALAG